MGPTPQRHLLQNTSSQDVYNLVLSLTFKFVFGERRPVDEHAMHSPAPSLLMHVFGRVLGLSSNRDRDRGPLGSLEAWKFHIVIRAHICGVSALSLWSWHDPHFTNETTDAPSWLSGKESTCNEGDIRDAVLIPKSGRSSGGGNGSPFQYSCLGNPMDRGAWWATVHGVAKSWIRLSDWAQHMFLKDPLWHRVQTEM